MHSVLLKNLALYCNCLFNMTPKKLIRICCGSSLYYKPTGSFISLLVPHTNVVFQDEDEFNFDDILKTLSSIR